MTRKIQRQTATTWKSHESGEVQDLAQALADELDAEKENQRKSLARGKELQAQLKELKTGRGKKLKTPAKAHTHRGPCPPLPDASSSGCVCTMVNRQHSLDSSVQHGTYLCHVVHQSDKSVHFQGGGGTWIPHIGYGGWGGGGPLGGLNFFLGPTLKKSFQ
jgi:hypothetical protein